jgi:hypothetical protein
MKKTYDLNHPKIKYERLIEGVKNDVRKYLKRSRKKALPTGADFWDFACKFGKLEDDCSTIHLAEVDKHINAAAAKEDKNFYIEIIPIAGHRQKK